MYSYAMLFPICLCNGPSVSATGGSTSRTVFLESRVKQSAFVPESRGLLETACWKVVGLEITKKKKVFHCVRSMGREGGQRPMLVIFLLWKEAGDTDKHGKSRRKLLLNVTSKIPAVQFLFCLSTKVNGTALQSV